MSIAVALVGGLGVGWLCWLALRSTVDVPALHRSNHRGKPVPVAGGLAVVVAVVAVEAGRVVVGADASTRARLAVVAAVLGYALLGLVDDFLGGGADRGFRGHLRALARGRLTTGGLKLLGGTALALALAGGVRSGPRWQVVVDGALIALGANLANLFDRAPGRALKVSAAAFGGLVLATGAASVLTPVAVVVGAGLALLVDDLRERVMLGDTGANVLGAVVALGCVVALDRPERLAVLVVVAVLNVASEVVSFSRVFDAVPPLRFVDRVGRLP
jgi:UDP-GlcNAc:undecaprenyl-phosphate GlcNAc-1-phosphate transferase